MTAFYNRIDELIKISPDTNRYRLITIYGEAGIGKTRLLAELAEQQRANDPKALILRTDLRSLYIPGEDVRDSVLGDLIQQGQPWLVGYKHSREQMAAEIVSKLCALAASFPIVWICDTTEAMQEQKDFWNWLEEFLVGPLIEARVWQIFAGRVPTPWRRPEVRRAVQLLRLDPLDPEVEARALVTEVLQQTARRARDEESLATATSLVLEFSFGHPLLCEDLGTYVARHWPAHPPKNCRRELGTKVVGPFIEQRMLSQVEHPWDGFVKWLSVLDSFDASILLRYLPRVDPSIPKNQPEDFYIKGISRLRLRNAVLWSEDEGTRLYGVLRDIVQHWFQVVHPGDYARGCRAAAETFAEMAAEFREEEPERESYREWAEKYRARAQQEVAQ